MPRGNAREVLAVFLRLGLTSFGGPIAHLGYFHDEFVVRRRWLDEKTYADLVALCQFLPGPASSQVGIAIGLSRAGYLGSLAAWLGFTLPSAVALVLFAYGVEAFGGALGGGWLHGLKVVAVAVVAQAVLAMMRTLAPDRERATLAVAAAALVRPFPRHGDRSAPSCSAPPSALSSCAARRRSSMARFRIPSAATPGLSRSCCSLRSCLACRCWRPRSRARA
jgi:chromate transporter